VFPRNVTREDIDHFAEFTGDTVLRHTDEAADAAIRVGGIVAHGYLIVSFAAGCCVRKPARSGQLWLGEPEFLTPVKPGDALTVT